MWPTAPVSCLLESVVLCKPYNTLWLAMALDSAPASQPSHYYKECIVLFWQTSASACRLYSAPANFAAPQLQAAQCARCRAELGVSGRVCRHCRLDEAFLVWEVRLFSLQTHAMTAGQEVTAEEAIQRVGTGPCAQRSICAGPAASLLRQVWH